MQHSELDRLVRRLRSVATLSNSASGPLSSLPCRRMELTEAADIYLAGEQTPTCFVVLEGCISRYKRRGDGSRAIVSFELVGDIVNLDNLLLESIDCGARANTAGALAMIEAPALKEILRSHPEVERALWRSAMVKAAALEEWLLNIGRRTPLARICHLLVELHTRLEAVDEASGKLHASPLEIGDAMGLQEVLVVRALKELEEQGLIDCSNEAINLLDVDRLSRTGDFRPAYLHLQSRAA